jgi:hypothetical protein
VLRICITLLRIRITLLRIRITLMRIQMHILFDADADLGSRNGTVRIQADPDPQHFTNVFALLMQISSG